MNLTLDKQEKYPILKTKTTLKLQDLDFFVEEIDAQAAAAIGGGAGWLQTYFNRKKSTSNNRPPTPAETGG